MKLCYGIAALVAGSFGAAFQLQNLTVSNYAIGFDGTSIGTVTFNQAAPGVEQVQLGTNAREIASVPTSVPIITGSDRATFPIRAVSAGCALITASYKGVARQRYVVVHPSSAAATFQMTVPDQVLPLGGQQVGTVSTGSTANGTVTLSSSNGTVAAVPPSAELQRGSASFKIAGQHVGCAIVSATIRGRAGSTTISKTIQVVDIGG